MIDLKEASACQRVSNPDYNYEYAFEVVAPKRTWILCPDDQHAMQALTRYIAEMWTWILCPDDQHAMQALTRYIAEIYRRDVP